MLKPVFAILSMAGVLALGGCETTVNDAYQSLSSEIILRGTNPYIEAPVLKDLEDRIRTIALAPNLDGPFYSTTFNPRNDAILANFDEMFSKDVMMEDITLARAGFDAAAAARYPVTGTQTGCAITDRSGYFVNGEGEPNRFDWEFVKGDCADGIAHGVGEARASGAEARFIGRFDQGVMLEGVFTMVQKDGDRVIQIGGVSAQNRIARLLNTEFRANGFQWHRYGDFDNDGKFSGFGANIWNYTNMMLVKAVGHFADGKLNGFAAQQDKRKVGEAEVWAVWIGTYADDKMDGVGAWTNGLSDLAVGEWKDGKQNGVAFGQYASYLDSYHEFYAGRYVDGKRHGPFKVLGQNAFVDDGYTVENYNHGEFVDDSDDGLDFGQVFALAAGTAVIGSSNISDMSKVEIGGAFAADVLGGGGNSGNLQSLQQNYQLQQQNGQTGGVAQVAAGTGMQAGGGLKTYKATITCEQTGVTSQIDVPYRTEQCRIAAVDFATTYSCNKLDQERVTRNCQSACGHPQCLEQ